MSERKCPACGGLVKETWKFCPVCGEKLPRIIKKKKRPEDPACRAFAGKTYGLILTPEGILYGIGSNSAGQIQEDNWKDWYSQPVMMAENVISAAAGKDYTIYVTRDGQVQLRGRGELVERFTGFSDAKNVFADYQANIFWIQRADGAMFAFGENSDLQAASEQVWKTLPEQTSNVNTGVFMTPHTYGYNQCQRECDETRQRELLKCRLEESGEYREAVERFGGNNVFIRLTKVSAEDVPTKPFCVLYDDHRRGIMRPFPESQVDQMAGSYSSYYGRPAYYRFDTVQRYTFLPEIVIRNKELYTPVPCPDSGWMADTPYRDGSLPLHQSDPQCFEVPVPTGGKKLVLSGGTWLWLLEDGNLLLRDALKVPGLEEAVEDLAACKYFLLVLCENGDILWNYYNDYTTFRDRQKEADINRCRLPQDA